MDQSSSYICCQATRVFAAAVLLLSAHGQTTLAGEQPGFVTAEELIRIYTPADESAGDKPLTRGMELNGIRGIGGVRKSKTAPANTDQAGNNSGSRFASRSDARSDNRHSFQNILFGVNSVDIRFESYRQLDELGKALGAIMQQYSGATFVVEGHTDSMGNASSNHALSLNRAEAIRKYLLGRFGFDEHRITSVGYGERYPVAPNDSEDGRKLNRRVEIVGN